jgi:hypothetical protein
MNWKASLETPGESTVEGVTLEAPGKSTVEEAAEQEGSSMVTKW